MAVLPAFLKVNPYLAANKQPRLKVKIYLSSWQEVDCLIDTGFSGGIALPESFQSKIKKEPLGFQEYELADGSRVIFALYEAKIRYKKKLKITNLLFTKSEDALVGIEFLSGFKFVLDLKKFSIIIE